ncbi:MAG: dihydropteroate synthase [Candidatus Omnitrophota bacterium]
MPIRVLQVSKEKELRRIFVKLKVDAYGIRIMSPKTENFLLQLDELSAPAANILKQEALSCGGDFVLPREAIFGKRKKTSGILIVNLSQFNRLKEKLYFQPFGLKKISHDISDALKNYSRDNFGLKLCRHKLRIGRRALIMGIMNLTPDSFSGDGLEGAGINSILEYALKLSEDGADIIDLGGESSRPGAKKVSLNEELRRVIPAVKIIAKNIKKIPISIDTCKPEVARQALDNGACIVNDISGLRNLAMAKICAKYKAGVVIMHMQGIPGSMQKKPSYCSVMGEIIAYLDKAMLTALNAGMEKEKIIIDPGIGFGKTLEHNLEILKNLRELKVLGAPILVGTSRKAFIGKILKAAPSERIMGTVASCVIACAKGANIVRVHDVRNVAQALKLSSAILN